jgi:large subunit ribosomal protein L24
MSMVKIRIGDNVQVISGKERGKSGKVIAVDRKKNRVTVEGLNLVKKHQKPNQMNPDGGIIEKEASMDLSNVMYLHNGKPTRIGFKITDGGKKVRVARRTGETID